LSLLEAILLGLIQGITEFLPISSTAHLTLAGKLLGVVNAHNEAAWTEFIAIMQMGTLVAVITYFFRDIVSLGGAVLGDLLQKVGVSASSIDSREAKVGWSIVVGTVPVAIIGLLFSKQIHGWFTKSATVIAVSMISLALLLWLAERIARHLRPLEQLTMRDAIIIGCAQAIALIPGSSRSGTTITAGLFLGLTRESAARFSFLLSIPAVLASGGYELLKLDRDFAQLGYAYLLVSTIVAGISGYAAIAWLLRYLTRNTAMAFVWYRLALGVLIILFIAGGLFQS
jgi:undecaprenyl-diphosphatase